MDPYDAGPDALNDNVNADDRDDDRILRGDGICTWGVKAVPQARVGRYLTGESGEMWGGGRDRGKRKGEGEEGRMGRLGQDKKWRGAPLPRRGREGGIREGGWVLGGGA